MLKLEFVFRCFIILLRNESRSNYKDNLLYTKQRFSFDFYKDVAVCIKFMNSQIQNFIAIEKTM